MATVRPQLDEHILQALDRREGRAALVAELAAALRPPASAHEIDDALRDLGERQEILITDHAAPDVHLESADLRIVARIGGGRDEGGAQEAADALWDSWLRTFLSTHRCQ